MTAGAHLRPADSVRVLPWILASAVFFLLLSSLFRTVNVPAFLLAGVAGIALLSVWRPDAGLLVVAGAVPIASWIGRRWNGSLAWPETVVVAFLAGYALRHAVRRPPGNQGLPSIAIPSLIAMVLASFAVEVLVLRATIGGQGLGALAHDVLGGEYFMGSGGPVLDAAMRLLEGLLLFHAAFTLAAGRSTFAPSLIRTLVIGAAAAGALNLWRIWLGALQQDAPVLAFLGYLRTLRYNTHYGDLNAAGSYFVMMLLPALVLSWGRRWWRWVPAVLCIGVSLVLSGSRTAIVAAAVAVLPAWYLARRRRQSDPLSGRRMMPTAGIAIVVAIACLSAGFLLAVRNASPATGAIWIRVEFARASIRMLESAPLFGIGIGQYPSRAGEFISPELLKAYPPAEHENAHNNFLQVLAELGIPGFAAFVWILAAAATSAAHHLREDTHNRLRWAAAAGAAAFVLSWLGGHPLLVDAPAFCFWVLLGAVAGWGDAGMSPVHRLSRSRMALAVLMFALLVSLPFRVRAEFGRAELDHQGIGLSLWQDSDDGVRYRLARVRSSVFVPSAATVVIVPLRAANPNDELLVELSLGGRLADVVRVAGDRWLMLSLPLPHVDHDARYLRLDLTVRAAVGDESPLLRIGKITPR